MSLAHTIQQHYRSARVARRLRSYGQWNHDERSLLMHMLPRQEHYAHFMRESSLLPSFDLDSVRTYERSGYCAHTLSAATRLHVRSSMRLYRQTGDDSYFVRRFHKDAMTDSLHYDIVSYYINRRDMTLKQISSLLSQKHGMRVPAYQVSRVARRALDERMWRRQRATENTQDENDGEKEEEQEDGEDKEEKS